ncbi:sulfotransferase [Alicyclobacillus mengziensis]|uniref:Sulfotransferase n=1 Tax=Alicyclobacillus mengziensis TaxID=2931921 RepID=A0A9X7VW16_9BACL|nr:sulfotransferase [Alicyclobacillus mengziensis]QSO45674.1 sulfotransferase [Alicyclobacillus mengziensis]
MSYMSPIKEPHFFARDYFPEKFTGPGDEGFSENRARNLNDYLRLFRNGENASIRGEGSVYYLYFPGIAERLYKFNPDAKVIIILRNPVDRAFSAYMHTVRDGRETLTFEQALDREEQRRKQGFQPLWWYRELGLYSSQVARYINVFPENQCKIFLFEDLRNTQHVMRDTFDFLNLDPNMPIDASVPINESGVPKSRLLYNFFAKPNIFKELLKPLVPQRFRQRLGQRAKSMTLSKVTMQPETRVMLRQYYRRDVEQLEGLIRRDLSAWLH